MTIGIFETHVLNRVVQDLNQPSSFLLDMFFREVQESADEFIHFDVDKSKPRITPFVSPLVAGKVVQNQGFTTQTYSPAYAKDKRRFNPNQALKRMLGENIGGNLNGMERQQRNLVRAMEDQLEMLTRREEVMASEALRLGQVTVSGDEYPTQVVDFGRDGAMTVALTSTDKWDDAGKTGGAMLDDIESWGETIQTKSGAVAMDVVMDPKAWRLLRKTQDLKDLLDTRRGSSSAGEIGPIARGQGNQKARFVGMIGSYRFWVYQDTYVDDAGATQQLIPDNTVIVGASDGLQGVRAYGMIQDEEAGFQATRYFSKSWLEKDPAVRWLLLQSAPLVVPYRVNAVLCATVA